MKTTITLINVGRNKVNRIASSDYWIEEAAPGKYECFVGHGRKVGDIEILQENSADKVKP